MTISANHDMYVKFQAPLTDVTGSFQLYFVIKHGKNEAKDERKSMLLGKKK